MTAAAAAAEHPPAFGPEDAEELTNVRAGLAKAQTRAGAEQIRSATEHVRRLAALIARYDLAEERTELRRTSPMRATNWARRPRRSPTARQRPDTIRWTSWP